MAKHNCAACRFRARYDSHQDSVLGRIWRWHANWCPGWRGYLRQLSPEDKHAIVEKYKLTRC